MAERKFLNALDDLKGRTIISADTAAKLGVIDDVVIHPREGIVLGMLLRDQGGNLGILRASDLVIGDDAVMTVPGAALEGLAEQPPFPEFTLASRLNGATVITEDGTALGKISGVFVSRERPLVAYRVAESTLKGLFGGGFYIAGDAPSTVAPDGSRVIVPYDADHRYASNSLEEALAGGGVTRDS
jgi:uncharacterized protein YrrD